ncbi:MAG: hypothetical protein IKZ85_10450 [Pseudobutyrivibrio sp.]|nr:hypothetical protein [Pseudobutyrivibrio sp.]
MEDVIDYVDALAGIAKQRELFEENYNTVFNNLEEIGYDISLKMRQLSNDYDEYSTMMNDGKLKDLFDQRESLLRDMQVKQKEFQEKIFENYQEKFNNLDADESKIRLDMNKVSDAEDY